jgi:hypothetical protein
MAPENPPPLDPADLPLLMTLEQLRNPAPRNSNVSFLRRTQYISSGAPSRAIDPKPFLVPKPKVQKQKPSRDDPAHVKKYILKGFDIAYPKSKHTGEDTESKIRGLPATKAELDAWANPVHPDNPKLKPVGFYPFIPDLNGFPDLGGLLQFKFDKAPVQANRGQRDDRMDVALLHPYEPEGRVAQEYAAKVALHKADPRLYPDPGPMPFEYDLFLPDKKDSTHKIRESLNVVSPNRDDPSHYSNQGTDGLKFHKYDRIRTYATSTQVFNPGQKYRDVGVVLFDPADIPDSQDQEAYHLRQKGAYYYPIISKVRLKPERSRTIAKAGLAPGVSGEKKEQVHQIQLAFRDPNEDESYKRACHRAQVDSGFSADLPSPPEHEQQAGAGADGVDAEMIS